MVAWKSWQRAETNSINVLEAEWVLDVLEACWSADVAEFGGRLSVLYAGEEPVAIHFGLRSKT